MPVGSDRFTEKMSLVEISCGVLPDLRQGMSSARLAIDCRQAVTLWETVVLRVNRIEFVGDLGGNRIGVASLMCLGASWQKRG